MMATTMPTMPAIRPMQPGERDEVLKLLWAAFESDPIGHWLWPGDSEEQGGERQRNYTAMLVDALDHATTVDVFEDLRGVALWQHVAKAEDNCDMWTHDRPDAIQLADLLHEAAPPAPYTYLSFLAVHPTAHGQGRGSALLQHRLPTLPGTVALWTGDQTNLPFYDKRGFTLHSACTVESAAAWWMVKQQQ